MGDGFLDKVTAAVRAHGPLCVGIDPSGALLADWGLTDDPAGLRAFGDACVEAFTGAVAVVKPQVAFFERHGAAGLGTEDGDPDATGWPMPGTLAPVPWARRPTAQVQLQMRDVTKHEPLWWDPRVLLDSIVQRLRADGLHPVIACELEFYLVDPKSAQAPGEALVPAGTHGRPQRAVNLSVDAIEQDGELLDAMRAAGLAQRLPVANSLRRFCTARAISASSAGKSTAPGGSPNASACSIKPDASTRRRSLCSNWRSTREDRTTARNID